MLIKHLQFVLGILIISTGLSGCYGDINVTCEFQAPGYFDSDSLNLYFFHSSKANRPAKGITAFPDGGIPKTLYKNVALYQFNIIKRSLVTIMDYGSLPYSESRWKFNLMIRSDSAAFKIEPVSGWENELKWGLDSAIYLKFRLWYIYNIKSGELTMSDSETEVPSYLKSVSVQEMKRLTGGLTYKERGIDMDVICPANKRERINELSQLKGNQEYRNALIETLTGSITSDEITGIISDINEYLNGLDDYNRLLKKESGERTIKKIEAIKATLQP
ncbi:MAG: hypothetical protein A2X05_15520 [Bacteroidetes bacterium GWE2_41_25]|nr:MAG: hypothetical protein A2X03_07405 [Bacteroidetes bacterium GWA2_40_15]OFX90034.1 MAG: hypothetical protein A2X06_18115 [Bacteroidetes bacterium GWC2_40_22]OFY08202.1 MAG: hypothetical protein A2X05_15520 [Bacteroidetes bacterium GWE2_41_25]OFY58022.1 MAG: hypothetical protein A2X04_05310 [Bacteroidetes bacterium GWF2_41_9]HBQ81599.1 hypothetical protein [Bacteroidales bacterium]